MILAEPPPSQADLHFSVLGFPVRIHPWFWLVTLMLSDLQADPIFSIMWVVAVLLCILLHELGHAVVMKFYGYRPSIVLYSFGGLAIPHPGPYRGRRAGPWDQMLIAFAGPASGFILAGLLVLALHYVAGYPLVIFNPTWREFVPLVIVPNLHLTIFLHDIFYITVMWGLVNLLPIYPLDGGQIAHQVFALSNPQDALRQSLLLSVIVGGMVTVFFFMQMMNVANGMNWQGFYRAMFFGYLTYSNLMMLQAHRDRGGWR